MPADSFVLGPDCGRLTVHVFREGVMSALGHDLVLQASTWDGVARIDLASPEQASVEVTVPVRSLVVKEAQGGLRKLTAEDEANIAQRIADTLGAAEHPDLKFRSTAVGPMDPVDVPESGTGTLSGMLSVNGREEPVSAEFAFLTQPGMLRVTGRTEVVQTRWGITPFRGLRFGLTVRDSVEVHFDVLLQVPHSGGGDA